MVSQNNPVNQSLASYIYNSLHQGYTLSSIRAQLASQGYSIKDINSAVDYVYATYYYGENSGDPRPTYVQSQSKPVGNSIHISNIIIPVLVIFAVLIFGFAGIFVLSSNNSETLAYPAEQSVSDISRPISDTTASEDAALNSEVSENSIKGGTSAQSNSNTIVPESTSADNAIEQNVAVIPSQTFFDANIAYTKRQIDEKVSLLAESNPREAMVFCDAYQFEDQTLICYGIVASKSGNSGYCMQVPEGKYRDDCYLGMVVDATGSTQECNLIDNAYKRDNCRRLADINVQIFELKSTPPQTNRLNPEDAINYGAVTADFY